MSNSTVWKLREALARVAELEAQLNEAREWRERELSELRAEFQDSHASVLELSRVNAEVNARVAELEAENERMRAAGHLRRANLRRERDEALAELRESQACWTQLTRVHDEARARVAELEAAAVVQIEAQGAMGESLREARAEVEHLKKCQADDWAEICELRDKLAALEEQP